jgi:hypothetical protein
VTPLALLAQTQTENKINGREPLQSNEISPYFGKRDYWGGVPWRRRPAGGFLRNGNTSNPPAGRRRYQTCAIKYERRFECGVKAH